MGILILRAILPAVSRYYVNKNLKDLGEYTASIDDIDFSIYRGALQIEGFNIKEKDAKTSLFTFEELDLGISWGALFRGEILANIKLLSPVFKYQISKDEDKAQTVTRAEIKKALDAFLPIEVNHLEVRAARLEWLNLDLELKEGAYISKLDLDARNLQFQDVQGEGGPFWIKAMLMGKYPMWAEGTLNLLSDPILFDVDFVLRDFNMTNLNPMLRRYVPIDITRGRLSVALEAAQAKKQFEGYVTVGFEDGDIVGPNQDFESGKHVLFEVLGGVGNFLLQNSSDRVIATFPLEKTEKGYGISTDEIVENVLEGQDKERVQLQNSVSYEKLAQ